jgi:orotidine-5'-phosphate decarboxylase
MKRIIFPLDVSNEEEAEYFIDTLKEEVEIFKIGLELFYKTGINWVKKIVSEKNIKLFLDVKLHDIPNTVYGAVKNLLHVNPYFITVHLEEYKNFKKYVYDKTLYNGFLSVTFLTSLDENDLHNLYVKENITVKDYVLKKAEIALNAGCKGVVCSAGEASAVKEKFGNSLTIVTPGIRLETNAKDDQKRTFTPYNAILNGSDFLVIGRPIRNAKDPLKTCREINEQIEKALKNREF